MAGWTTQKELLRMEIKQREEEGCDVRGFAERFARLGADPAAVESLYDELMALPIAPDFPYEEPQTLEGIREHQNILGTLVNGDEDKAKELITIHISNARNHIYAALKHNDQL